MKTRLRWLVIMLAAASLARGADIVWHPWSDEVFAQARRENKFVYMDLEAVWCHWCHVMDSVTYRDPAVIQEMNRSFIAVRVDQDSRPDLAARYEDWGWPATVIYAADGTEIVKKQGYVPPGPMVRLLRAVIEDPSPVDYHDAVPEPAAGSVGGLAPERRQALRKAWIAGYDDKAGGWGFSHKFLDRDGVELALREAAAGNADSARRARDTLRLQRKLMDPVRGGVFQYSVGGSWDEPHFEKIMQMQAENLKIYAQAYAQWGDPACLESAHSIRRYLQEVLTSPDGAFYTSQDADSPSGEEGARYYALDDAGRRAQAMPRIDKHTYARENGWAIEALAQYAAWTGDASADDEAIRAARWVLGNRALPGGGFRHDERDAAGPYLGDTLGMGRAFWSLYQVTADTQWLAHAAGAAEFICAHFSRGAQPGFAASDTMRSAFPPPRPEFDENVSLARFGFVLAAATGRRGFHDMALKALQWAAATGEAESRGFYLAGLLLADNESRGDPLHVAVVGRKDDPGAQALFASALRSPASYKLVEYWDRREGPAPRGEDIYPEGRSAAAFVCAHGACSAPLVNAPSLDARLRKLEAAQ